jgi:hypothetical protein
LWYKRKHRSIVCWYKRSKEVLLSGTKGTKKYYLVVPEEHRNIA